MTYKNGFREYSLTTVLFGVPMGFLFGLARLSLLVGMIAGVFSGLLYTLLIFLFSRFMERKFANKREELAKERKIFCDGAATIQGNGGWMYFTEQGIEFYPHKINISTKEIKISMDNIEAVKTRKNQLIVSTADKSTLAIVVCHNKEWKEQIETVLGDLSRE